MPGAPGLGSVTKAVVGIACEPNSSLGSATVYGIITQAGGHATTEPARTHHSHGARPRSGPFDYTP